MTKAESARRMALRFEVIQLQSEAPVNPKLYVLAGGVAAGAIDIVYACVFWAIKAGVAPTRIFQSVAAGLLGPGSFTGGAATAALGLALHFSIATTMSVAYYTVGTRYQALHRRPVMNGMAYGLLLYVVMNHVVVPLSRANPGSTDPLWIALTILVHVFGVGMPIALAARAAAAGA